MFDHIIGNDPIKSYLKRLIDTKRISHSLLFAGPEGVGKSLFAQAFAKMLLCQNDLNGSHLYKLNAGTHPDLHIYSPEGKIGMHSIAAMRSLSEEVYLPPYEASCKVFILQDADRMLSYSANALLKTFEEPPKDTIILLLSSSPELILPTILSRCSLFHFHALKEGEMITLLTTQKNIPLEKAKELASMAQGSVSKALYLLEQSGEPMRKSMIQVLTTGKFHNYSSLLAKSKELAEIIGNAIENAEAATKEVLLKGYTDKLSAVQKEGIEKEIEGVGAMHLLKEADSLFDLLLTWYRDRHLLKFHGNVKYLFNADLLAELTAANDNNVALLSLESLLDMIKAARLALARSTPIHMCLENLFLKLNLV